MTLVYRRLRLDNRNSEAQQLWHMRAGVSGKIYCSVLDQSAFEGDLGDLGMASVSLVIIDGDKVEADTDGQWLH